MTEKKKETKKVSKEKYNDGFPSERGFFKCKVGDKEMILVHHICTMNGKHWWSDTFGRDVVGDNIKFSGKKLTVDDI